MADSVEVVVGVLMVAEVSLSKQWSSVRLTFITETGGGYHGGNINRPSEPGDGGTSFADFNRSFLQLYGDQTPSEDTLHSPMAWTNASSIRYRQHPDVTVHEVRDGEVRIIFQQNKCCNNGYYSCLITGQSVNDAEPSLMKHCICGIDDFMQNVCVRK